jgi:hypothetical protein
LIIALIIFSRSNEPKHLQELVADKNKEKSCLHLGFFLASWGMFRMSGKLGQGVNAKHFLRLIDEISQWDGSHPYAAIWDIDVPDYDVVEKRELLMKCCASIKQLVLPTDQRASRTLVTKIMLGIFGCVPAFDDLFTATFRSLYGTKRGCAFRSFDDNALVKIHDFYVKHSLTVDKNAKGTRTLDFQTGRETQVSYTKAKIIDMIGFQKARNEAD